MATQPYTIKSLPGIKRDGTRFENGFYVDGQWCRFQRGLPRKMWGYRTLSTGVPEISRGLNTFNADNTLHILSGGAGTLTQFELDPAGVLNSQSDRNPAGFVSNSNHLWTFDVIYDSVGASPGAYVFAHPGDNLNDIDSETTSSVYWGLVHGSAALTANSAPAVSGGVVALYPYAFVFGSDGFVSWSVANSPNDWIGSGSGSAYITAQKIVAALPLRAGPGSAPAGLFWSLDSLVRCTFTGGTTIFQFDTISAQTSILSSQSVIEYDGIFYWCGVDRFLQFNGVVREVPNQLNQNWFFDNLNYNQRQKVFAYKVPRFGEIWWCFPFGDATECTHAIIYNIRENTWYDTVLPNGGRSAGKFATVYQYPFMMGIELNTGSNAYSLWQHEFGVDEVNGTALNSIPSSFTTADISLVADPNSPKNRALRCSIVEPDFIQKGEMTCQITGRANARAPEVSGPIKTFPETPSSPEEQVVFFKEERREMRFTFASNTVGGDYQMGQCIAHIEIADGTLLG